MDELNIVYKCIGYFKNKVYLWMNNYLDVCHVDSKSIKNIYIEVKNDFVYLVVDEDIKAYCLMCNFEDFVDKYYCNYKMLLSSYHIIELNNYYE